MFVQINDRLRRANRWIPFTTQVRVRDGPELLELAFNVFLQNQNIHQQEQQEQQEHCIGE